MAEGLNRACLMGYLGQDPELKFTQGGQAVLKMRLATTESYPDKKGQRQERTEWHTVVLWGKRAEGLSKYLSKGSQIYVEGSIQTRSWEDKKDGGKRYATEINAQKVLLAGGGNRAQSGASSQRGGSPSREAGYGSDGYEQPDYGPGNDDDIPF